MEEYLTAEEVCSILKIARVTLYLWIKKKGLKATKFGKGIRVKKNDLDQFITEMSH